MMGYALRLLMADTRIIEELGVQAIHALLLLRRIDETDLLMRDPWTARVFLFHDHDWEIDLMARAFTMPHFYIGALGGRRAHAQRRDALRARGIAPDHIESLRAPIGLFHSSRDPQTLALSTLAEIIRSYQDTDLEAQHG